MPIYEYRCECGATLEAIERMGARREKCAELCAFTGTGTGKSPKKGEGQVERLFSGGMIRGDGREAKEPVFDPCKKSNRPGGGCGGDEY